MRSTSVHAARHGDSPAQVNPETSKSRTGAAGSAGWRSKEFMACNKPIARLLVPGSVAVPIAAVRHRLVVADIGGSHASPHRGRYRTAGERRPWTGALSHKMRIVPKEQPICPRL